MAWTLWRGEDLLGTVHQRSVLDAVDERNNTRHVNAVLVPLPAFLPLPSVIQRVMDLGGDRVVLEHEREPHLTRVPRGPAGSSGPAIGIWPISNEPRPAPPGVPRSRQLQIRNEEGKPLPLRSVGILEHRPHPDHPPSELAALPEGAFVEGSIWLVHFTEELAPPASQGRAEAAGG